MYYLCHRRTREVLPGAFKTKIDALEYRAIMALAEYCVTGRMD